MILTLAAALLVATDSCAVRREFDVRTTAGHLLAAEVISADSTRKPTVILISGAGAQTRDYSTDTGSWPGGNRAFELIAVSLVRAGYSVIRFDERGTGLSTGEYERSATTATLADDVRAIIAASRLLPEVDGSRIMLLGHSEGGAIATLVGASDASIRAVILLAAPAWSGERIMAAQHRWLTANGEWSDRHRTANERAAFLEAEHADRVANDPWYRYFLKYDPLPAIRQVKAPVLILHGDLDRKVSVEQAHELAAAARAAGNARVTEMVFPKHTHALGTLDRRGQEGSFSAVVLSKLLAWIQAQQAGRAQRTTACDEPFRPSAPAPVRSRFSWFEEPTWSHHDSARATPT